MLDPVYTKGWVEKRRDLYIMLYPVYTKEGGEEKGALYSVGSCLYKGLS